MSVVIWHEDGTTTEVGGTLAVLGAFAEMGKLSPGDDYGELNYVPWVGCDDMPAEWAATVQEQAAAFLEAHGAELAPITREILEVLVAMERTDGDCTGVPTDDDEDGDAADHPGRLPQDPGDDAIGERDGRR